MRPAHGNLRHTQAIAFSQKQDLRIETEALHALLLKNDPCPFPAEGLESALRVRKFNPHDPPHQAVKKNSSLFADHGLVDADEAAVHGSGADGPVISPFPP